MGRIKKSRNLFLEKEELTRIDKLYIGEGYQDFIKNISVRGGLILSTKTYPYSFGTNFLFSQGSDHKNIKLSSDSVAYNTNGNRIIYKHESAKEFGVPFVTSSTKETWIYVQAGTTSIEEGNVSLASNGQLTGVNTKFTEVFRGQTTLVPNKIRIYERVPNFIGGDGYSYILKGTYEVTLVSSDESMLINVSSALTSADYVYSVVGAFSPGTFDDSREEEIYEYDSFELIYSDVLPLLTADQYMLCKVTVDDSLSTQTIEDLRVDIFKVLGESTADYSLQMFKSISEDWDSLIIEGIVGSINNIETELTVTSGKVYINNIIYETNSQVVALPAGAEQPYWELFSDSGVIKARVVFSLTKLAGYYDYDQNYRTKPRVYSATIKGGTMAIVSEKGFWKNRLTFYQYSTVDGEYVFSIDGNGWTPSISAPKRDDSNDYVFSTNCKIGTKLTKVVQRAGTVSSYMILKITDLSGANAISLASTYEYYDLKVEKISKLV